MEWNRLVTDPGKPLLNEAVQAQLAPGSVFKVIMATAGLQGDVDPQLPHDGGDLGEHTRTVWDDDPGELGDRARSACRGGRFRTQARPRSKSDQIGPILLGDDAADFVEPGDEIVENRKRG